MEGEAVRPGGEKALEHRGQDVGGDTAHRGHAEDLGLLPPGDGVGLLPESQPVFRHRGEDPALLGGLYRSGALAPVQQPVAQLLLQRPDPAAQSGLGDKERLGRLRETAGSDHSQKGLQLHLCHNTPQNIKYILYYKREKGILQGEYGAV